MTIRNFVFAAALALCTASISGGQATAAGASLRAKFSFDGIATCQNPPVQNFPIHGEGTGVLSADRSATLDMTSTVEGRVQYTAKLGGAPMAAPEGSASLRVAGRHTLRATREYPNNLIIINLTVVGSRCSMTIDQRLKPGKRQYTFYNGSGLSYCSRPTITRTSCEGY
ncbi:hypothetical protein UP09_11205 [Bradyrhizobium sp. LTSP885]|nr:hypothetical protein UP09_11205 [Bradyrhizobium sp. LTSP885]